MRVTIGLEHVRISLFLSLSPTLWSDLSAHVLLFNNRCNASQRYGPLIHVHARQTKRSRCTTGYQPRVLSAYVSVLAVYTLCYMVYVYWLSLPMCPSPSSRIFTNFSRNNGNDNASISIKHVFTFLFFFLASSNIFKHLQTSSFPLFSFLPREFSRIFLD